MILRSLIPILLLVLLTSALHAQRRHHAWYFGNRAGIDFNAHPPEPLTDGRMYAVEGSAMICDPKSGDLLFYTNGDTVWDGRHRRMPNGIGLAGFIGASQSAVIVPAPGDTTHYYIFTVDAQENMGAGGLRYSVVDMTLNGGWGDVRDRNTPLIAPTAEKLCAVRGCNGDYRVITHDPFSDAFYSFHVTATGVDPVPVVSHVGGAHGGNGVDWMSASPDGRRLGVITRAVGAELFTLDPCSGIVSNAITLPPIVFGYGLAFSADNSKLYIGENRASEDLCRLVQFDLASNDSAAITASAVVIFEATVQGFGIFAMRPAPDGRIYIARCCQRTALGVINHPNRRGVACDYRDSGFALAGRTNEFGLPNFIDNLPVPPYAELALSDSVICAGSCVQFFDSSRNAPTRWRWIVSGSAPSFIEGQRSVTLCFDSAGVYPVRLVVENEGGADSITRYVTVRPAPKIIGPDTLRFCGDTSALLDMTVRGGLAPFRYSWSPSIALNADDIPTPIVSPSVPTDYTLNVIDANGCRATATVHVEPGVNLLVETSLTDDGEFDVGASPNGRSICRSVRIINQGLSPLILDDLGLEENRAFSIPPSQFPFVLAAGEERELEICYASSGVEPERDTLRIESYCSMELPLVARPVAVSISGSDGCGTTISIGRSTLDGVVLKVSAARPMPAAGELRIEAEVTTAAEHQLPRLRCQLHDLSGAVVAVAEYRSSGREGSNGLVQERVIFILDAGQLPSGLYFADIQGAAAVVAVPVVIGH